MGFGNRLKDILRKKGITIKELAEASGISLNTLYSITKRDTQLPSQEIISKIANALGIEESELLTFDDVRQEIKNSLDKINQTEIDFRKKLLEISEMLNADALAELLNQAIDMLQHDSYRSIFYKKHDNQNDTTKN